MRIEILIGALLATAFWTVVELFHKADAFEMWETLKLIVQFAGALFVARVAVGWALDRFKTEKMWDRRITALADVMAALREMVRVLDKWMEEELHAVQFTDDYKTKLDERWDKARTKFEDVAAIAILLLPTEIAAEIGTLEAKLTNTAGDTRYEMMEDQWGAITASLKKLLASKDRIISEIK